MNDYEPGEVHTRMMTPEEREADRKRREQERLKYPWRTVARSLYRNICAMRMRRKSDMRYTR